LLDASRSYQPHKCRVETWLGSKTRLETEFAVQLHSIDFEILHYSAGLVIASGTDQNILRIETVQDARVARIQKKICFFNFEKILKQLHKAPKVPRSAFR